MAVGANDGSRLAQTLVENWGGTAWYIQPSADQGPAGNVLENMGLNVLYAVSCYGPVVCTAVGAYIGDDRKPHALIEQKTAVGNENWTISPSNNSSAGQVLYGVSCNAAPMCAAVGFDENGEVAQTLDDNWAGDEWAQSPTPSPGKVSNFLTSDWCDATSYCVAAGDNGPGDGVNRTLAMDLSPTHPGAPTGVLARPLSTSATVSFQSPKDDGGLPVTSFTVSASDLTDLAHGGQTAGGPASPLKVTGLTSGDTYTFKVLAMNAVGAGPLSAPSKAIVIGGAPTVTSVTPNRLGQGATALLEIVGSGFRTGATASVADPGVTLSGFSVVSTHKLKADMAVALTATTGTFAVTVNDLGGSGTCSACFTVFAHPTVTAANPPNVAAGAAGAVTFTGSGFFTGATLQFSGPANSITASHLVVHPHKLTALVTVPIGTPLGPYTVTVRNVQGASGNCATCFSVIAAPTVTSLSNPSVDKGSTTSLSITGTGFAPGAKVRGPTGVSFTAIAVVSPTSITATMTVSATASSGGNLAITVANDPAGGYGKATADLLTIT
jgi:hypothetical protein